MGCWLALPRSLGTWESPKRVPVLIVERGGKVFYWLLPHFIREGLINFPFHDGYLRGMIRRIFSYGN